MSGFMSDQDVVARILGHIDNQTTDRSGTVWREPVSHYQCPDRFAAELALFRTLPIPFCPSAALSKTGDYIARKSAHTPLIVLRGRDGKARAFKNACRHRGAELATGAGCAGAFVCPYHGWSYDLDGALIGIPHEEGFPDFDKAENNLIEVTAIEAGGIIYVIQQDPKDNHAEAVKLLDGLPQVLKADQTLFAESTGVVDANWKLHLESFLEGYHIKPAHKTTFFPFGYDNLNVIESSGPHSRVTFPFKRIEALRDVVPSDYEVADKLTYVTHLFPIVLIAELSHHVTLGILEPLSVNQTKMTSYHLTRSHDAADKDAAIAAAKKDLAFVNETGQKEDIALVTGIQKGLQSGANEVFTFGEFEGAIIHFHSEMARRLPPS